MSLTAAASGFVVFLLSVQVIQGQSGWRVTYTSTQICAVRGSTVEIRCTYTYPSRSYGHVVKTFWFTKMNGNVPVDLSTDAEYAGRVQYHCDKNDCTLRITDLRERDSAEYKFRFITNQGGGKFTGSPGVTLSVTDFQVQVSRSSSTWTNLKCHSSCRLPDPPSYIWYKNGEKIQGETFSSYSDYFGSADSYSCAVKGFEEFPSPPVCARGQSCNRVTYTDRSVFASKGSSVDISCTYSSYGSITSSLWFSPARSHQWQNPSQPEDLSEDSQYAGRVQVLETERGCSTLRITDLRESDSAEYRFRFTTGSFEWRSSLPATTLTVTALQVQVSRATVHQSYTEAELKCHSSCSPAARLSYVWFNNGQKIMWVETFSYKGRFSVEDIISCAFKGHEDFPSPSVYAPKLPSVSVSPSAEIVEGSSVTLTCSSDANPAATYTWYKKNSNLQSSGPQLVFSSIQSSDSGEYYCTAENELGRRTSEHISVNVKYAPKTSSVSVSPSGKIMEGRSVSLTCSSDANPAAKYTWYRENHKMFQRSDGIYNFTSISSEDRGTYYCKSENQHGQINSSTLFIDVQYAPKLPSVSVSPSAEIVEGSSVTLTCSSDANPAATYTWYKENQTMINKEPQLVLRSIQSSDSGEYYCTAENELGRSTYEHISVNVKYAPKLPSVSVSPSAEIVEGSSVNLTCSSDSNPAATYTWYKENQTLIQGPEGIYQFTSISSEDSGIYYCKSENQYNQINSSSVFIDVQYAPKLPSVSVSPSAEIVEGSSVTLTCSSDSNPAATYTWYKENEDSPKASGQIFTITDFRPEHSGNYYCAAVNSRGRHNSSLHLTVVAESWKSIAVGTTTAAVLAVILLSVFIVIRKKRASKPSSEPAEGPDNREQYQPTQRQPEEQDDLHYASVQFSKNHTDSLYSNIRPAEEDRAEYAEVKFSSSRTAPRSEQSAEEDPAALYSTVNKTR